MSIKHKFFLFFRIKKKTEKYTEALATKYNTKLPTLITASVLFRRLKSAGMFFHTSKVYFQKFGAFHTAYIPSNSKHIQQC